ncbi:CUN097 hypothetical protein [Culex nigripalpus nucleopolyhedrovirus]|uniref:Uncharacterized protein n=1 Tax=Culex nigripalpus nucleopolyhedrovirus (isolate Florida/1997) TaxID=645993 RepID=Q919I0_NPVCO|nr:CUN097 hypothetical protein [Culex nigripalpus nucleopolyhedrovirus]AAK94175.1 CUN097 hypothetical protein [Culex nigripalpus nucleopolyhedrovirus]
MGGETEVYIRYITLTMGHWWSAPKREHDPESARKVQGEVLRDVLQSLPSGKELDILVLGLWDHSWEKFITTPNYSVAFEADPDSLYDLIFFTSPEPSVRYAKNGLVCTAEENFATVEQTNLALSFAKPGGVVLLRTPHIWSLVMTNEMSRLVRLFESDERTLSRVDLGGSTYCFLRLDKPCESPRGGAPNVLVERFINCTVHKADRQMCENVSQPKCLPGFTTQIATAPLAGIRTEAYSRRHHHRYHLRPRPNRSRSRS